MRFQTLFEARWIFAVILVLAAATIPFLPRTATIFWVLVVAYVFYFFRDPDRVAPQEPREVVAAADGRVADIEEVVESEVLKVPMKRVGIFLSVFDVHTNRAPVAGRITYSRHHPGKFLDARHPDATRLNEFHTWAFENPATTLVVRQITGAIARRIVAWSSVGDEVKKGERFGMIRFGSRTEIYLPASATVTVKVGDRVQGGASIIARLD